MTVLSKLYNKLIVPEWSFKYNCYEVGHTWDPSCTYSCLEITGVVFDEALRMYGSLSVAQFFFQLFLAHQKRMKEISKEKSLSKELKEEEEKEEKEDDDKQQLIKNNLQENVKDDKNLDKQLNKLDKPSPSSNALTDRELIQKILMSSVRSWIRSSCFLGFNAFAMFSLFCFLRKITGRFYYSLVSIIPATLGCLMAIHIEKPNRRAALAVYVANVASEVLFKMGQARRYYDGLGDNGTALMFATSLAAVLYRVRRKGYGKDPVSIVIKMLLGRAEKPTVRRVPSKYLNEPLNNTKQIEPFKQKLDHLQIKNDLNNNRTIDKNNNDNNNNNNQIYRTKNKLPFINWWSDLFEPLDFDFKHHLCKHDERSCFLYAFKATVLPFFAGYVGQCLFSIGMKPQRFLQNPTETIRLQFTSKRNLSSAIFLALFTGGFKGLLCSLRWLTNKSEDWHVAAAGFLAGLSQIYAPNSTLATYVLWKAIESFYVDLYKKGYVPSSKYVAPLLYALSVNTIFYAGILEPYNVRPSYAKFLERITKGRLHLMNRSLLAVFGTNAFIGYEEFWPDLDIKQCSREFMQDVLVWKLEDK